MMLELRRPALAGLLILAGACGFAGAEQGADPPAAEAPPAPARPAKRVIDITRSEKIVTARLRVPAAELRDLVYRLLDDDGFRVTRIVGDIPLDGQTLKAKKHLRHVECELVPDRDPNVSTLSFEYTRFGNQAWSDRALEMVIVEVSKDDPPDEPARKIAETSAPAAPAAPIPSVNYFGHKVVEKSDPPMPIPALSIDPDAPAQFTSRGSPNNAAAEKPAPARPVSGSVVTRARGDDAEVVTLPEQKGAPDEHPSETLFRSVQRGDVDEKSGEERISVFLQVAWIDARRAPTDPQRHDLAHWLAHALAERQIGSKDAGAIVGLIDRAVGPAQVSAEASKELVQKLRTIVEHSELEEKDRAEWIAEIGALLSPASKN
jgi:hypothetical protein